MGNTNQIILENALNVRHLGSIKTIDNKVTKDYAFIRTDTPYKMSKKDIDTLISLGVSTVIDLRYEDEVENEPNPFAKDDRVKYYHIPLMSKGMSEDFISENFIDMGDLYTYFLNKRSDKIAEVFKVIATQDNKGGIMFHCTIGKDRTGVIAAVLLMLANVSEEDILRDYSVSYTNLKPMFDKRFENNDNIDMFQGMSKETIVNNLYGSKPEFIKKFIDELIENYKTAENYLKENGLSNEEIISIKDKLL